MQRRHFLQLSGTCGAVALAGCVSNDSDDAPTDSTTTGTESETERPSEATTEVTATTEDQATTEALTAPIETVWDAYNDADLERMQAVIHPDSDAYPTEAGASFEGEVTVSSTTVIERSDDSATVEAALVYETEYDRNERTDTYELRRYEGRWVIWSQRVEGGSAGGQPVAPQAVFSLDYDTSRTSGTDTGVVTLTHDGGDTLTGSQVSIRGSGIVELDGVETDVTAPGTTWGGATGLKDVAAGDQVTIGVTTEYKLRVVWESANGERSATLASYSGPDS